MTIKLEEGWITVVLLGGLLTISAWGIIVAGWTDYLWVVWPVVLAGLAAGLALAKSRFSGIQALPFAFVYGVFVVGLLISSNLNGTWHERSVELVIRLNNFLYKLLYGGTNRDNLPFPVAVALLYWVMSASAAWAVFRRQQAWTAVIPAGFGLFLNAYYYLLHGGPAQLDLYLAVYVLLSLLLVARMSLLAREQEWQAARVSYSPEMRFDFLRAGLLVAVFGVVVGWAGPALASSPVAATAWGQVSGPLSVVRESWMRLFASIRARGQTVNDYYGDSLALGGATQLSDAPIMDVTRVIPEDQAAPVAEDVVARYYWRATAHDTYVDGRWSSDNSNFKEFDPAKQSGLRLPIYLQRRDMQFQFRSFVSRSSRLYTPAQPKWVDRPVTFEIMETPGGALDVTTVMARDILLASQTYRVTASISVADMASLRQADADYPDWVTAHFLQLPDTITARTRELARQIVHEAGATNPFDQAQAVTDWLRANITYDQQIEAPPQNVEPVDWLLFVSRRGYCNYYATAEVILLRSLGIPARLAVGFAQGQWAPETNTYRVLERHAHAWPEVFFPMYGWVEFEPTASESPLIRPERRLTTAATAGPTPDPAAKDKPEPTPNPGGREAPEDDPASARGSGWTYWLNRLGPAIARGLLVGVGLLALLSLVTIIGIRLEILGWENLGPFGRWLLRLRHQAVPTLISLAYLNLERATRWMGLKLAQALTPHERAAAIIHAMPDTEAGVTTITTRYVEERYSPHLAPGTAPEAWTAWVHIRWSVWRQALVGFVRSWTETEREAAARRLREQARKP